MNSVALTYRITAIIACVSFLSLGYLHLAYVDYFWNRHVRHLELLGVSVNRDTMWDYRHFVKGGIFLLLGFMAIPCAIFLPFI